MSEATPQTRLESLGYAQQLHRGMSFVDLVVYGLIFMCPMAPISVFGFIYNLSGGLVAAVYSVAAVAMYFSALSYSEMAQEFPVAGSVYSYVRFAAGEFPGFFSGWAILLDYLLLPGLTFIFTSAAMHLQFPGLPQWVWVPVFVVVSTTVNLRGIGFSAMMNLLCLYIQLAVIAVFAIAVLYAMAHGSVQMNLGPFFRRDEFPVQKIFLAIPIAALNYIGFDAISTLNEEAKGGGQAVSKATMTVLFAVATLFVLQVYLATTLVPLGSKFGSDSIQTAFYEIAISAVGPWFKPVLTMTTAVIAMLANAFVAQATTSRLIFSMARDQQLPMVLAAIHPRLKVPARAILAVGAISAVVGIIAVKKADLVTSVVTFGSLTSYILLHLAVIKYFAWKGGKLKLFKHCISPMVGLAVLSYALWSTSIQAKTLAAVWFGLGLMGYFLRKLPRKAWRFN